MKERRFIGMFDSGVGGLSVWREVVRRLPHEAILYLADQAHVPYGSRSLEEVCKFAEGITRFLLAQGAKVIVIASNTTSAAALNFLRNLFPDVPFVGMEPALKPAVESTRTGAVGVLATPATFQGELYASLMERYTNGVRVVSQACPGLVDAVEAGELDSPETAALLKKYLAPMIRGEIDQLVLGCTHYPFLQPLIEQLMGPGTTVIDPAPSIARHVTHVLTQQTVKTAVLTDGEHLPNFPCHHVFFTSGDVCAFTERIRTVRWPLAGDPPEVRAVCWQANRLEFVAHDV